MHLLIFHFNKADDSHKAVQIPNLAEILLDVFGKDSINMFENYSCLPSLSALYQMTTCTKFDLLEKIRESIVEILHHHCGMGTYSFQSRDNDEVFCKVEYNEDVLLQEAENTQYLLQMNESLESNDMVKKAMPFVPYVSARKAIYQTYNGFLLRDIDRIRLMEQIIRAHIRIEALQKYQIIVDFYPLHEEKELEKLEKSMLSWNLSSLNSENIRNYLGEKLCFYFLWLEFYANQLFTLGVVGVGMWLLHRFGHRADGTMKYHWIELFFAIFVCVWCAMFQIKWERKSNFLSLKFGTKSVKANEFEREQFVGNVMRNSITGELEKTFDQKVRIKRQVVTYLTTFFMIGLVIALTISLFIYRAILIRGGQSGWGPMVIATVNTLQIYIMNVIYDNLAVKLNDWENHKTQTEYENGLIVKKVGYQFVNYFISLFYIAFIKEHWDGCDNGNCMGELNYNLWVMFAINMVFNIIEIGGPILSAKSRWSAEERKVKKMFDEGKAARLEMTTTEKQGKLEVLVLLNEYLEVVMNFGYIIFFCVAFPLGPIIYWIFNILEIKGDAYKFFVLFKRPFPRAVENIGVWSDIMSFMSIIGVVTNTALMIFTENIFNLPMTDRWGVFIVVEHVLMFTMVMMLNYYPKQSYFMKDIEREHEILKDKHFYQNISHSGSKKAYQQCFTADINVNFRDN